MLSEKLAPTFSFWKNISISKKLYFVFGAMALLIIVELLTLRFAMGNLSAVRAFVGGEASWSKAQKNAVYRFQRYAMTKDENDYLAFHESLKIPDGDRKARVELLKANPDDKLVRAGFIEGHVHPDDIESVVNLLKRFYSISYISEAVNAWTEGDKLLLELRDVALKYHQMVSAGEKNTKLLQEQLDRVILINDKLTGVEEVFSRVLGEGSRWLESVVFMILFFLVITVESIGLTLTFVTSRSISRGLGGMNKLSEEYGRGDFSRRLEVTSGDEIGQLTASINRMGDMLQKSYNDLQLSHKNLENKIQERTLELEKIAHQNNELYKEAKNAVRMRDDFLSIASHELRTPLTALNLQLYLLEKASKPQYGREPDFDQVTKISKRASFLVKKLSTLQEVLMDLAQLRLGKLELKKEHADFAAIVTDSLSQVNSESIRGEAEFILEPTGPIFGNIDPTRVSQVVTNLLTNALKYGDGKPVRISISEEDHYAKISVTDEGPGIPLEKQEQVFDRFERVSEDPAVSGLGLGLYISKQIVEAHEGHIWVESSLGHGTTFQATFSLN
jgi:signal transduction histidine kinase